jgi:hypothetical protein
MNPRTREWRTPQELHQGFCRPLGPTDVAAAANIEAHASQRGAANELGETHRRLRAVLGHFDLPDFTRARQYPGRRALCANAMTRTRRRISRR